MCGIVGICNFDESPVGKKSIQGMCDSIRHRGPDDEGIALFNNIGIGMRRLSIIDLSGGHQPITNEDKSIWVVLNGEIYNYLELREGLVKSGHIFKTNSDTESIVHLYEEYGIDCLQHLQGMFAFALFDAKERALFIARDRLGIKPLFYYLDNERFLFASEIKAILSVHGVDRDMDFTAMDAFFTYTYIPAPKTIFKSIQKLEPGHFLLCNKGNITIKKYWDLYFRPDHGRKEKDIAEEFTELFSKTVYSHLISDVPLGVFLSGGIDSSLVTALMRKNLNRSFDTFTIKFGGKTGGYFDESVSAGEVARRYGANYNEYNIEPHLTDIIDLIVKSFDEPFADDSVVPTYHICRLAAEKVKVALTGLGGDEMFGGYNRYLGFKISGIYSHVPKFLKNLILDIVSGLNEPQNSGEQISRLKRFVNGANLPAHKRYQSYISSFHGIKKEHLFKQDLLDNSSDWCTEIAARYFTQDNAAGHVDKALYLDTKMYLPDDILALSDRLSMRHSLELRVPFVDHRVAEFCAKIPASLKIKWARKKHLLKKISERYIPKNIINNPKQGFASPMTSWIRHDIKDYVTETLSRERLSAHGFFNEKCVENIIKDHMEMRNNNYKLIFSLLMFQKWFENYGQGALL